MTSNNTKKNSSFLSFIKCAFKSVFISMSIGFLLVTLLIVLIINVKKYEIYYPVLTVVFQALPSFISGKSLGRIYGHSLLFIGLISGVLMLLLFLGISVLMHGFDINESSFIASIPYIMASGVLGSITSGKSKKKVKY